MKRTALAIACLATLTTQAAPQLGIDFRQNNWAYELNVGVFGISDPADSITLFDNGFPITSKPGIGGDTFFFGINFVPDLPFIGDVGLHTLSLEINDNGSSVLFQNAGFYTVAQPTGEFNPADQIYSVFDALDAHYIFNGDATPAPDSGCTLLLLAGASAALYRRK